MDILYGFKENDMKVLKEAIESRLAIRFELRNSSFRCGDYFLYKNDSCGLQLIIQLNCYDEVDKEYQEDYPEYPVLLYVSAPKVKAEVLDKDLLKEDVGLSRLRSKEYN